jgi:predicted ArsR family transcriptional regulator
MNTTKHFEERAAETLAERRSSITPSEMMAIESARSAENIAKEQRKNDHRSTGDFIQISTKEWLEFSMALKPYEQVILAYLIHKAGKNNAVVVTVKKISEALGCHYNTVLKHLASLKEKRYLRPLKYGNQTVYLINPRMAWKTKRSDINDYWFNVSINIDMSEQTKEIRENWDAPLLSANKQFLQLALEANGHHLNDKELATLGIKADEDEEVKELNPMLTEDKQQDFELDNFIKGEE